MKILLIGGTGTISSAITRQLATEGHDLHVLNRGSRRNELPEGVKQIIADIHHEDEVREAIGSLSFDAVCEFIGFVPSDIERDFRLFCGKTRQYVFISSASVYNKPARSYIITEGTTQANPFWQYARDKIACEELLMRAYREKGFPITIVRPSHTYSERGVPTSVRGTMGCWPVLKRMLEGKPVIIQGDGSSLWTMTWNEDFARGFIGLLGNPKAIGEVFQIMSDESLTWDQIYQTIAEALGVAFKPYHVSSDFIAAVSPEGPHPEGQTHQGARILHCQQRVLPDPLFRIRSRGRHPYGNSSDSERGLLRLSEEPQLGSRCKHHFLI